MSDGAPGTRAHSASCCPAFRDSPTVLSALSQGTMYSPLSTNCALTQPPPSLLPLVALGRSPPSRAHSPQGPAQLSTQSHRRSRLTGALTLAYPQPHPPEGGACSSSPQASAPQPSLDRLYPGPPSQVKPNQHSLSTSGELNAQSTSMSALWEQPPSTEGGQMSMPSPSLPSLQLTPPH